MTFVTPAVLEDDYRMAMDKHGRELLADIANKAVLKAQALGPKPAIDSAPVSSAKRQVLGREVELDKMGELLQRAFSGERQILFVTGEPGIGKTMLEIAEQLQGKIDV